MLDPMEKENQRLQAQAAARAKQLADVNERRRAWRAAEDARIAAKFDATQAEIARIEAEDQIAEKEIVLKATLKRHWIEAGGAPANFDAHWPELREEYIRAQTLENMDAAQAIETPEAARAKRHLKALYSRPAKSRTQ